MDLTSIPIGAASSGSTTSGNYLGIDRSATPTPIQYQYAYIWHQPRTCVWLDGLTTPGTPVDPDLVMDEGL